MRWLLVAHCVCAFLPHPLDAAEIPPLQTDRPDQTESPFVVPVGHLQVESGFSLESTDDSTRSFSSPSLLLRFGLGDRVEARCSGEYASLSAGGRMQSGFLPASLGVKIGMAEERGPIPSAALIAHLVLPRFSSEPFRTTFVAPALRFAMQHTPTELLSLGYNLGVEWDGEGPEPAYLYTLTAGLSPFGALGCYIEIYGFARQSGAPDHLLNGGCTWLLAPNIMIDCSAGAGVSPRAADGFVSVGMSFRVPE